MPDGTSKRWRFTSKWNLVYHHITTVPNISLNTAFNLLDMINRFILTPPASLTHTNPSMHTTYIHLHVQQKRPTISSKETRVSLHSALSHLLKTHIRAKRWVCSSQCPPSPTPASCSCSCSCSSGTQLGVRSYSRGSAIGIVYTRHPSDPFRAALTEDESGAQNKVLGAEHELEGDQGPVARAYALSI